MPKGGDCNNPDMSDHLAPRGAGPGVPARLASPHGGDWLNAWLLASGVRAATLRGCSARVRLYLVPDLGGVLRAELNIGHLGRALTVPLRSCPGAAATSRHGR